MIVHPAAGDPVVLADGKLLSRVMDNLMNNIGKYAMPGTRVYAAAAADEKESTISIKNVSRNELNVSADELMERFVRGDSSRHTEGSGLGLSIAKSLVELQGGRRSHPGPAVSLFRKNVSRETFVLLSAKTPPTGGVNIIFHPAHSRSPPR